MCNVFDVLRFFAIFLLYFEHSEHFEHIVPMKIATKSQKIGNKYEKSQSIVVKNRNTFQNFAKKLKKIVKLQNDT